VTTTFRRAGAGQVSGRAAQFAIVRAADGAAVGHRGDARFRALSDSRANPAVAPVPLRHQMLRFEVAPANSPLTG
jgi:hypothetical protein